MDHSDTWHVMGPCWYLRNTTQHPSTFRFHAATPVCAMRQSMSLVRRYMIQPFSRSIVQLPRTGSSASSVQEASEPSTPHVLHAERWADNASEDYANGIEDILEEEEHHLEAAGMDLDENREAGEDEWIDVGNNAGEH